MVGFPKKIEGGGGGDCCAFVGEVRVYLSLRTTRYNININIIIISIFLFSATTLVRLSLFAMSPGDARPLCDRRSALRVLLGPRLPPGLLKARPHQDDFPRRPGHRPYRHCHATGIIWYSIIILFYTGLFYTVWRHLCLMYGPSH